MGAERRVTRQTELMLQTLMTNQTGEWSGSEIAPATGLKSGTLYPALLRMERFGWLTWRWEEIDPSEAGRPRRRLYKLTTEGELAAAQIESEALSRERRRERREPRIERAPRGVSA
jgi:PadR family transcriptional regulator PadR